MNKDANYDVVIIGSGMAGLSAGLYAGRYELSTTVIGDMLGGATSTAWTVENYPGYKEIDGYDLIVKVKEQNEALGVKIINDRVSDIDKTGDGFELSLRDGGEHKIQAKTVIFAVGAARRKLGVDKEDEFSQGKGVHYCATCDAPLYKGKTIAVVGGGDASVKGMNLAVQYAEKVHAFVRGDALKAEPINYERLEPHIQSGKVEIHYKTEVTELVGTERLTGVKTNDGREIELDGLFVEIGAIPEVELAEKIGVKLDEHGYIGVNNMMETNVRGVYAAGDTTSFFGHFKQDITAAAMGAVAATSAFNFIGGTAAKATKEPEKVAVN
ncbi:MAG: FAD-dependent oxidoreductase [Patescibacteria group bacterium]